MLLILNVSLFAKLWMWQSQSQLQLFSGNGHLTQLTQSPIQAHWRIWGGGHTRHMPPYRTQFFHFYIHFCQKAPASGVHAPLWEILDLPLKPIIFLSFGVCSVAFIVDSKSEPGLSQITYAAYPQCFFFWSFFSYIRGIHPF